MIKTIDHISNCNRCSSHLGCILSEDIKTCGDFLNVWKNKNIGKIEVKKINDVMSKFNNTKDLLAHSEFQSQKDNNIYHYYLEDCDIEQIIVFFEIMASLDDKFKEISEHVKVLIQQS